MPFSELYDEGIDEWLPLEADSKNAGRLLITAKLVKARWALWCGRAWPGEVQRAQEGEAQAAKRAVRVTMWGDLEVDGVLLRAIPCSIQNWKGASTARPVKWMGPVQSLRHLYSQSSRLGVARWGFGG